MSEQLFHKHAQFEFVWRAMHELNIGMLIVSFDGSGDSGDIQDISPYGIGAEPNAPMDADTQAEALSLFHRFDAFPVPPGLVGPREDSPWIPKAPTNLKELVHELSNEILSRDEAPDWVNNDGGYGELKWICDGSEGPATIEVEYNIRVVHLELEERCYDRFGQEDLDEAAE